MNRLNVLGNQLIPKFATFIRLLQDWGILQKVNIPIKLAYLQSHSYSDGMKYAIWTILASPLLRLTSRESTFA